ncbi:MAG: hypothetical protein AB7P03_29525 [Kofleriaceae bacterium]
MFDRIIARVRAKFGEPLDKRLRRRLFAAARADLAELREGLHCRVEGTVALIDDQTIEAPVSRVRCVAYAFELFEASVEMESELIASDRRGVPFMLVEADHRALVEPTHAMIVHRADHDRTTSRFELDAQQRALIARYLPTRMEFRSTHTFRFREHVVVAGDRVAVAGTGSREADPHALADRGYRDHAQNRLRFIGDAGLPLLIGRMV